MKAEMLLQKFLDQGDLHAVDKKAESERNSFDDIKTFLGSNYDRQYRQTVT